jgi:hypothetical protein
VTQQQPPQQVRSLYQRIEGSVVLITLSNTSEYCGKLVGLEINQFGGMTFALGKNVDVSWPSILVRVGMDDAFSIEVLSDERAAAITEASMLLSGIA